MSPKPQTTIIVAPIPDKKVLGLSFGAGLIVVDPGQEGFDLLDSAIHEAIHRAYPHFTEQRVRRASAIVSDVVWRLEFRRDKPLLPGIIP